MVENDFDVYVCVCVSVREGRKLKRERRYERRIYMYNR